MVLVMVLASAPVARADEPARKHLHDGTKLSQQGHRDEAVTQFELGYQASGKPDFLYLIAKEYAKSPAVNDLRKSQDYYRRYLADYQKARGRPAPEFVNVEAKIADLGKRISAIEEAPPPAPPVAPTQPLPPPSTAKATATPAVSRDPPQSAFAPADGTPKEPTAEVPHPPRPAPTGEDAHEPSSAVAMQKAPVEKAPLAPETRGVEAKPSERPRASSRSKARLAAGGVLLGIGLGAVAAGAGILSLSLGDGSAPAYQTSGAFHQHYSTFQTGGAIALGLGAAVALAGVVTLAIPSPANARRSVQISLTATGITAEGSF